MSPVLKNVEKLKTAAGWNGIAVPHWSGIDLQPEIIAVNPDKIFKSDNCNIIFLKKFDSPNGKVSLVVKKKNARSGVRRMADLLRKPKALRNFRSSLVLKQNNIEVAEPVAAFWNSRGDQIYISEYIKDSLNLYDVAYGKDKEIIDNFSARKDVITKVSKIIIKLFKAGFWHRDSKAGNFIIYKDGNSYKVKLIDLDGIKKNYLNSIEKQKRTLANLAKSLIRFKNVNLTDLYRGFKICCTQMGIDSLHAKDLFREIAAKTVALRLLMFIDEADRSKA